MSSLPTHRCKCAKCRPHKPHPDRAYSHQINLFLSCLNEPQRRWFAALEAICIGHGDKQLLAHITGLSPMTIRYCHHGRNSLSLLDTHLLSAR